MLSSFGGDSLGGKRLAAGLRDRPHSVRLAEAGSGNDAMRKKRRKIWDWGRCFAALAAFLIGLALWSAPSVTAAREHRVRAGQSLARIAERSRFAARRSCTLTR